MHTVEGVPLAVTLKPEGLVIITESIEIVPIESVTVTVYVPAARLKIESLVEPPGDHEIVYGKVSFVTFTQATPSFKPLQEIFEDKAFAFNVGELQIPQLVLLK